MEHLATCARCCEFVAALNPDAGAAVPRLQFDRYELLHPLGAGGMGMVFAAYDPKLERRIAIKLLPTDVEGNREVMSRRMKREAVAMAQLSHPNVVSVYDVGIVDDQVYIAMELVSGQTLTGWLDTDTRTLEQRLAVLRAAGEGLVAIHSAGLVHRDFKPDNILIDSEQRVRVTDLGIATAIGDQQPMPSSDPAIPLTSTPSLKERITMTRSLIGTPAYMAPEQLAGELADARADQFSFCITVYECVFGAQPFAGSTLPERMKSVSDGQLRIPTLTTQTKPIYDVVARGLSTDPTRRYPSMRALLDALLPRRKRWRPRMIAAAAAVLVLGCAAAAWSITRANHSPPAKVSWSGPRPAIAVLGLRMQGGEPSQQWLAPSIATLLIDQLADDDLRVVSGEEIAEARNSGVISAVGEFMTDPEMLDRARKLFAVDLFVTGRCIVGVDGVLVELAAHDSATGVLRWQVYQRGSFDQLPTLAAQAVAAIREKVALSRKPDVVVSGDDAEIANPAALQAYSEGIEALRRDDYTRAEERLLAASVLAPHFGPIHASLADVYDMRGKYEKRQQSLATARALVKSSNREQQLSIDARYRLALGEFSAAIELYRSLATFYPDNPTYGYQLVKAELGIGAPRDGLAVLDRLRAQPGRETDPWIDLLDGEVRRELGDLDGAERMLKAAIDHGDARHMRTVQSRAGRALGWVYVQRGQFERAEKTAHAAVEVARGVLDDFSAAHGLELLARVELFVGKLGAAEGHIAEAIALLNKLTFRTGFGYNILGFVQLERGRFRESQQTMTDAVAMAVDQGSTMSDLALPIIDLALLERRNDDAAAMVQRLARDDEHSTSVLQAARYQWKHALLMAAKDQLYPQAIVALQNAASSISFAPSYAALMQLDLARVFCADRQWTHAIATALSVSDVFATMGARDLRTRSIALLVQAYLANGDVTQAEQQLAKIDQTANGSESPLTVIDVDLARAKLLSVGDNAAKQRGTALRKDAEQRAAQLGYAAVLQRKGERP
jgi:tetratricopeptide (TPR) repeat protein